MINTKNFDNKLAIRGEQHFLRAEIDVIDNNLTSPNLDLCTQQNPTKNTYLVSN